MEGAFSIAPPFLSTSHKNDEPAAIAKKESISNRYFERNSKVFQYCPAMVLKMCCQDFSWLIAQNNSQS